MNNTISIILPISTSLVKDFSEYFDKAIKSITNQSVQPEELIIVHSEEKKLIEFLESYDFGSLKVNKILWKGEPNYCSQVNLGIKNAKSDWISFFEFDDEYSAIWFKNVEKYMQFYPEVEVFLPVVVDVDEKNAFAGFTNEATFAANFAMEVGYLTNETLHNYQNFQSAGAVYKKKIFDDFGGFKPSIKLTFVYEFLLRLTYNSVSIMTIPRLGYKHTNMREGSIFWNYKFGTDRVTDDEVKFWLNTAKKEYFFVEDRAIKYTPQNV
jgi:glycosyltransferase involved in cell wall biosynthesis